MSLVVIWAGSRHPSYVDDINRTVYVLRNRTDNVLATGKDLLIGNRMKKGVYTGYRENGILVALNQSRTAEKVPDRSKASMIGV